VSVRLVTPSDDLALLTAVSHVAFAHPDAARAEMGEEELAQVSARVDAGLVAFLRDRVASRATVMAVAQVAGAPVAVGSHQPVGVVTEIAGVGTLPAFRRRGIAAAVTSALAHAALRRGVRVVFLSAADEQVARVYARAGFRHLGAACVATPPAEDDRRLC
jgi:predicted GNAT family acetyltransferase